MIRLVRAQWVPLAALGLLTFAAALLAVAVPARTAAGYDRAAVAAIGPGADVRVQGRAAGAAAFGAVPSDAALGAKSLTWQQVMPKSLQDVTGEPEPSVTSDAFLIDGEFVRPRLLYLGWDPRAAERVRLVSGIPPINPPGATTGDMKVILAKRYADQMGYKVGDRLALGDFTARINGLFEPRDPADEFWLPRARMLRPVVENMPSTGIEADAVTALIDQSAYVRLTSEPSYRLLFSWRFPVREEAVRAGDAEGVAEDLDAYRSAVAGRVDLFPCEIRTGLDVTLKEFAARLHTAQSVLGLAFAGLVAVAAGVLLLAAGLLGVRLRPLLGLMRARGASLRQLAVPACGLVALAVVPSAALGYTAGRLLDAGPPQTTSIFAIALLVAAVLLVSATIVARERSGGLSSVTDRRDDLATARPSRWRRAVDLLLVVLAAVGVVLLRERGPDAGTDPLIAAVPVLLGVAVGVVVLRVYPYLLRATGPFLRRRSGAVAFIGLARAARQNLVGALPVAVLLLAAAVAGFTATVDNALKTGQVRASWARVGADARVEAGPLDEAGLRRIRAVPGVTGVVRVRTIGRAGITDDPAPLTVVGVDLDAYRRLAPKVPDIPGTSGVLASPLAADTLGTGTVTISRSGMDPIQVRVAGEIERFPGQDTGSAFVIVPYSMVAKSTGFPSQVFVGGHDLDAKALRAAAPGHAVTMREDVLHGMTRLPLVSVVHDTFRDGALIGGAFGLLVVVFVLVVGARTRARTIAHLRALGLSRRQSRALALVEIAPVLLCATAAGWVLGLLLPEITGPVVDLRPYTNGYAVTAHVPGVPALLGLIGALLLAAAAALAVDRVFDASPGTVLRTGDS
ncbi:CRISPR-associated protein Cas5 [Actinomadura chibensis]|uniref:CRISPR-associated protein Cas5 n=1 Tax=Actinomadura chibensis TaxID=392828 RepID=A0A5D0NNR1_9ACTN|nr:CRISPR-associated protein Cas5 [Actinomadura chibensis]TYB46203.1 CRISPR-associated protein Cas5 [Actinomadura chibensis]